MLQKFNKISATVWQIKYSWEEKYAEMVLKQSYWPGIIDDKLSGMVLKGSYPLNDPNMTLAYFNINLSPSNIDENVSYRIVV